MVTWEIDVLLSKADHDTIFNFGRVVGYALAKQEDGQECRQWVPASKVCDYLEALGLWEADAPETRTTRFGVTLALIVT